MNVNIQASSSKNLWINSQTKCWKLLFPVSSASIKIPSPGVAVSPSLYSYQETKTTSETHACSQGILFNILIIKY